jgi:hypothetical protein
VWVRTDTDRDKSFGKANRAQQGELQNGSINIFCPLCHTPIPHQVTSFGDIYDHLKLSVFFHITHLSSVQHMSMMSVYIIIDVVDVSVSVSNIRNWYSVISHGNDKSQVYGSYGNNDG